MKTDVLQSNAVEALESLAADRQQRQQQGLTEARSTILELVRRNRELALKRSLLHCHAHNVHSIMLSEGQGPTVRLFVAEPGHKLAGNGPLRFREEQSVGFHAHHCDLTLMGLRGWVGNWIVEKLNPCTSSDFTGAFAVTAYEYRSAITHGKIGFKPLGDQWLTYGRSIPVCGLPLGDSWFMPAAEIHTVIVLEDEWAAWLAIEGTENPHHDNLTYSASRLDQEDFSGFYKPMDEANLDRLIAEALK